jgi:N-methylhydantoinase B
MRCVTDPNIPNTEGFKAPIRIIAEPGTLVNAKKPAACNQRMVVSHSVVDLIFGAIQAAAPDRAMGDSVGCAYNELMATNIMTGGQMFFGEAVPGGIGATSERDGASCLSCHITNTRMAPVEMTEMGLPVSYRRRELADDTGGPGRNRGGLGIIQSYEIRIDEPKLSHTSQKTKTPPQGAAGGSPGRSGRWFVNKDTAQERELLNALGDLDYLQRGDVVTLTTAGGGGYGNPLERDVNSVVEDVREGYVSVESALADYGVEIDPKSFEVMSLKR